MPTSVIRSAKTARERATALAIAVIVAAGLAITALVTFSAGPAAAATVPTGLHVAGNKLLDGGNNPIVLRGVNRPGTEYQCIYGSTFDGPHDDASIAAMASWHINAVRVPLNEDCWLGINTLPSGYSASTYRSDIESWVNQLHAAGLVAILDLHFTEGAGGSAATGQQPMPDATNAPTFWSQVASVFKNDSSTVFDLFNEPYGVDWPCWLNGGSACNLGFQAVGMQSLLSTVRATGATNPVLVAGLSYANDLSQWLQFKPNDSATELMASWHTYGEDNTCNTTMCWDSTVAPVAAAVPLVADEIGEKDCLHGYIDHALPWLDDHNAGYLGWGWHVAASDTDPLEDCKKFPDLITDYSNGTPTAFGVGLYQHLESLAAHPTPTPTPGTITVTKAVDTHAVPYYYGEDLYLTPSASVTKMTVTVTVKRTTGITYNDFYSTASQGDLTLTHSTATKTIVYTAKLNAGHVLSAGGQLKIEVQFNNRGPAHATSGDTYVLKATVGGTAVSKSGHF